MARNSTADTLSCVAALLRDMHPKDDSPHGRDLLEARADVLELVAAARALRGKRGAIMALTQTDARSVRFWAALDNVDPPR